VYAGSGSTEERVDFNYGPDRKRWSQTYYNISAGSYETTDYIGGLFEQVIGSAITGTIYRYYIYAGSEPIAVYARTSGGTNTFNYVLSDHQGSVSDLTSSTGTSTVNESFTPYGLRRNPTTWSGAASNSDLTTAAGITRQAYTFQTQLGLWMGLNHVNGRVEDSMIGRFLSADPYIPDPTNTQSYNRYSYVNNNPLTLVDPTGFDDKDCLSSGCPGDSAAGTPEQSSWSCYGNCGLGYANTYGTVTVPGTNIQIPFAGSPAGALDTATGLQLAAIGNAYSVLTMNSFAGASGSIAGASGSIAQGSQPQGEQPLQTVVVPPIVGDDPNGNSNELQTILVTAPADSSGEAPPTPFKFAFPNPNIPFPEFQYCGAQALKGMGGCWRAYGAGSVLGAACVLAWKEWINECAANAR
jgi:RHS repeat-associated protein